MSTKTGFPSIDKIHLQGIPEELLNPELQTLSMLAIFLEVNKEHMDEPALEHHDRKLTKKEVFDQTLVTATALQNYGLQPEDRIVLILPNCIDGVLITLAANAIGIQVAYLDDNAPIDRLKDEVAFLEPQLVLAKEKGMVPGALLVEDLLKMSDPAKASSMVQEVQKHAKDEGLRLFLQTSGSMSGRPKTLPYDNKAIFSMLIYQSNSTGTKTCDREVGSVLTIMPYQHGYGWCCLFVNLMGGNHVVIAPGIEPEDVGNYYKLKTSYIYGSPIFAKYFMELTPEDADLSYLKKFFVAGFSAGEEFYQSFGAFLRAHNCNAEIVNNYGTSEALCIGTAQDGLEHVPGSIGKLHKGPTFLFVDEDLNEVKYDEPGEMLVSSASLCDGYYKNEEATKAAFIMLNGKRWFRTGDYMALREDGHVFFRGRKQRFFQPSGSGDKVNCEDIEHAISGYAPVDACAVIVTGKDKDVPDGACAYVQMKERISDYNTAEAELREHISGILQPYQMPREIVFLDEIPVMPSSKPDYTALKKMYQNK